MRGYRIFSSKFFSAPKLRVGALVTTVLLVAISISWLSPAAPLAGPGKNDRKVTLIVSSLMKGQHLSRHPLDDEISKRAMKIFTEGFDGRKLYFLQSDIDEFRKHTDICAVGGGLCGELLNARHVACNVPVLHFHLTDRDAHSLNVLGPNTCATEGDLT